MPHDHDAGTATLSWGCAVSDCVTRYNQTAPTNVTPRLQPRSLILLLAAATLYAQTPTPSVSTANDVAFDVPKNKPKAHPAKPAAPLFNLDTIVLDPAHGGSDNGATISDNALEKAKGNRTAKRDAAVAAAGNRSATGKP